MVRKRKGAAADFMKIRRSMYDVIVTNGATPIQFPSTRRLAEEYGVSQPTAARATRDLVAEGVLTACAGGGFISRPISFGPSTKINIFGIVSNLGLQSFDGHYHASINAAAARELTRRSESYRSQQLFLEAPSLLDQAVKDSSVSGLILNCAAPLLASYAKKARAAGLPVVSFMREFDEISSVFLALDQCYQTILTKLFQEGRERILIITRPQEEFTAPIANAVDAASAAVSSWNGQVTQLSDDVNQIYDKIEELLHFGVVFDAVIFYPFYRRVYNLLNDKLDLENQCRIVLDELSLYDDLNFTGYAISQDLERGAKILIDELLTQKENPESPPIKANVPYEISVYQKGVKT